MLAEVIHQMRSTRNLPELVVELLGLDKEFGLVQEFGRRFDHGDVTWLDWLPPFTNEDLGVADDAWIELSWDSYQVLRLERRPGPRWELVLHDRKRPQLRAVRVQLAGGGKELRQAA